MLIQDLTAQIETATEDREAKAQEKAAKLQKAAEDKGDLVDTTATRDSDQTYLDELVATCAQKSSDFEVSCCNFCFLYCSSRDIGAC